MINHISGDPKGNHTTVAFSKPSAEESPKGFSIPNQIKMTPKDKRMDGILALFIVFINRLSNLLKISFMIAFRILNSKVIYCNYFKFAHPLLVLKGTF
jgi:hypothetical protein